VAEQSLYAETGQAAKIQGFEDGVTMFTLVEPFMFPYLLDRPNLGCAMLVAACRAKGINTTLINGQTRWLKEMFLLDGEELWNLARDINVDDVKNKTILEVRESILIKGSNEFQNELKSLYRDVFGENKVRAHFNLKKIEEIGFFTHFFITVYKYYLNELNHDNLGIITRCVDEIKKTDTRWLGFSLQMKFDDLSRAVRKKIKSETGMPIVIGGSMTPFLNMNRLSGKFEDEFFDYLIIGPGERSLPALIEALDSKKDPQGIVNVFHKKGGDVMGNELKAIDHPDDLPFPDYTPFDLDLYFSPKRVLPLQSARGCSWRKCAFCTHSAIYLNEFKAFSVERTVETIRYLKQKHDCSHFAFHDDELVPSRAKKISGEILKSDLKDISIYAYARLTKGYNNTKLLASLRQAGFSTIAWGLESGSQKMLDLMNKGTNISTMTGILEKSSQNGFMNFHS